MTTTFRKILMATTVMAGLAIFTLDAAQAGPNGPSFSGGSISGFSSMRMDFNRIGGPGRALSRDDLRVVPLDVVKTTEKPKDTKNVGKSIPKKGTNVARVSNPKSVSGGKGKEDVDSGPNLHIPAGIADIFHLTGGNIGDVSGFREWADRISIGPLVVADPFAPNNEGSFPFPWPKTDQTPSDRNFIHGWPGSGGVPRPFGSPEGKVGSFHAVFENRDNGGGHGTTESYYKDPETGQTLYVREQGTRQGGDRTTTVATERDGSQQTTVYNTDNNRETTITETYESAPRTEKRDGQVVVVRDYVTTTYHPDGTSDTEKGEWVEPKEKDSQPTEEGSGRPSNGGGGWCSPTGGCYRPARNGSPRIIPTETEGNGTISANRQSPSWATDPSEEGYNGGGGGDGGYTGYNPQDEEEGGIGGPGNPALRAQNAPL